ncbi:MAG: helix-turn-helix domain containing protein [Candidatus Desulfofervidaceae bacterium]|nr:helix-turn-helix domain containing protein [Candidatus Desulfofervidaceae bacterium]
MADITKEEKKTLLTNPVLSSIEKQTQMLCPFCHKAVVGDLGEHIKKVHGEKHFKQAVLEAKKGGISDEEIGRRFGISYRQLEQIITESYGANVSALNSSKKVKTWKPENFEKNSSEYLHIVHRYLLIFRKREV